MYHINYEYRISPSTKATKAFRTEDLTDFSVASCNATTATSNSLSKKIDSDA
jgi:hypothetical protein